MRQLAQCFWNLRNNIVLYAGRYGDETDIQNITETDDMNNNNNNKKMK